MKHNLLWASILLFALLSAAYAQDQYGASQSYDRFKDETTLKVTLSLMPPPGARHVRWVLFVTDKGELITHRPATVGVVLFSISDDWIYGPGETEWRLILNGSERLALGTAKRLHIDVKSGMVTEGLGIETVPLATIEKIAKASKVEMRIGRTEFALVTSQIEMFKDFLSRLPTK